MAYRPLPLRDLERCPVHNRFVAKGTEEAGGACVNLKPQAFMNGRQHRTNLLIPAEYGNEVETGFASGTYGWFRNQVLDIHRHHSLSYHEFAG
jgi:hypothetical protein